MPVGWDRTSVDRLQGDHPATERYRQTLGSDWIPTVLSIGVLMMTPRFPAHRPPNHTHLGGYTRTVSLHRVGSGRPDYRAPRGGLNWGGSRVLAPLLSLHRGACPLVHQSHHRNWCQKCHEGGSVLCAPPLPPEGISPTQVLVILEFRRRIERRVFPFAAGCLCRLARGTRSKPSRREPWTL